MTVKLPSQKDRIKPIRFVMVHDAAKANMLQTVSKLVVDGQTEVVVQPIKKGKTLAQLGGFWGPWLEVIQEETGEDKDTIATMLKAKFLAPIYVADYADDDHDEIPLQAQWVELMLFYSQGNVQEKLNKHVERLSLSIATRSQMTRFMNDVDAYYANKGIALPYLDRFRNKRLVAA
jgi:hypothetical protein